MLQKFAWLRIVSIVGLVGAIAALTVEPAPVHGFGTVTSEGVEVHQASQWHNAGITGQGVKVGVIDTGFEGIEALLGTELPATVQARCYTDAGQFTENLSDCETRSNHGTMVAESLMDMAPGVALYIAKPSPASLGDLRASTDWMISEGVQVINHSVGWPLDGPGDGTSPFSSSPLKTIDHAVENGVVWINAASNDAENTWFTNRPLSDPDGDRFVNFSGVDEGMSFYAKAGDSLRVQMRWDDTWGGATKNLDLLLLNRFNQIIGGSYERQGGGNRDYPLERFAVSFNVDGRYSVAIGHRDGAVPGWTQLLVQGSTRLEYHTLTGSIFNPEESANPGMLAVGAAPWFNPTAIAPYSGRGPTTDGRTKPEVSGADCAATTFRQNFCGTSQASPHVAGMAALVRQRFPELGPVEVAEYLKDHAVQREQPDPNNTWGHGFAVLPLVALCSNSPGLAADCTALLAARDTLAGTGTLNWAANIPVTSWDGVTVGGSPLRVTELYLPGKGLTGEIPAGLGDLSDLQELDLTGNQLTGTIPVELGQLANLTVLALGVNQLSGEIPAELGSLAGLEELYLGDNQLSGTIPTQLGGLASLKELNLGANQLSGTIPMQLGSLTNLEILSLTRNRLGGEIPPQLAGLTSLEILALGRNQLTGTVPTWLGDLSHLEGLYLWGNGLTGTIPAELGSLAGLERLRLRNNELIGAIPSALGDLTNLEELHLDGNQLSGGIPPELGSLAGLEELRLHSNELSGAIPSALGDLTNLRRLYLWDNQLIGPLPQTLTALTALEQFYFYRTPGLCAPVDNAFQTWLRGIGTVLGSSCALVDSQEDRAVLETLYNATGGADWTNKANWLSDRPSREWYGVTTDANGRVNGLFLWENQLSGTIPTELGSLTNLTHLWLDGNQLSGGIPSALGSLTNLGNLRLDGNQLTGEIPSELGSLTNLTHLRLDGNQLSGGIPSELGSLTNLVHLRLDGNELSGEIPSELGRLMKLEVLYLSGNLLTGCVPDIWRDVEDNDLSELGLSFCPPGDPLITRYDTNGNGMIDRGEVIAAINHYLSGGGDRPISRSDVIRLINLYLSGS